jgi:23S rRNA (uracil1939-C5)-methyltransferase
VCAARLPRGSRVISGSVEETLAGTLPTDLLILNPPRAGLHPNVTRLLALTGPRTLVYISCNPATLARDLRRMEAYRVESVRGFDMFPQTAHVETVCILSPAA